MDNKEVHITPNHQQKSKLIRNGGAKTNNDRNSGEKSVSSSKPNVAMKDHVQKPYNNKNGDSHGKQKGISVSKMVVTKVPKINKEEALLSVRKNAIIPQNSIQSLKTNQTSPVPNLFKRWSGQSTTISKHGVKNSINIPTEKKPEIVIQVEDQLFRIDRKTIFAKSRYIQNFLLKNESSTEDEPFFLEGITVQAFTPISAYFENGELSIGAQNIGKVLEAAVKLEIDEIEEVCLQYKDLILETGEYMKTYELATKYGIKDLRQQALELMEQNFSDIVKRQSFLKCDINKLCLLLNNDNLNVPSEKDVFDAGIQWLVYDLPGRQLFLQRVMNCIRFPLMSTADLVLLAIGEVKLLQNNYRIEVSEQYQLKTIIEGNEDTQRRVFDALIFKAGLRSGLAHRVAHLMPKLRHNLKQTSTDNLAMTKLDKEISAATTIQAGFKGYYQRQQEQLINATAASQNNLDYVVILQK